MKLVAEILQTRSEEAQPFMKVRARSFHGELIGQMLIAGGVENLVVCPREDAV
jgi:hypothetical protein